MAKIFISYSHKDDPERIICQQIRSELADHFDVWFDAGIKGGQDWWQTITGRISKCQHFICLISENWLNSPYCQREYDLAQKQQKHIVPICTMEVSKDVLLKLPKAVQNKQIIMWKNKHLRDGSISDSLPDLLHALYSVLSPQGTVQVVVRPGGLDHWCRVAAGDATLDLPSGDTLTCGISAFDIGKYPITNRQFYAFLDNEYENRYWWHYSDSAYQWRLSSCLPDSSARDDYPCTNVCWYDAIAFCNWLSFASSQSITLPSDFQWQRAAQGDDQRVYPWGNQFDVTLCNTHESGINQLVLSTRFSGGASPFGVMDMVGNIWEWCVNPFNSPRYSAIDRDEPRSVRGGSWRDGYRDVGAKARKSYPPNYRHDDVGFRIVRTPASNES